MGSILYIEGFGVSLANFGFYQGAIAGSFAVISFLSPELLTVFGQAKCFKISVILITIISIFIGLAALCGVNNPVFITALMCMFALPMVLPVNILYPLVLEVVPDTKSRAAAVVNVARLVVSAICIETVSYAYDGTFLHLGLLIFGFSTIGMILARSVKLSGKTLN